MRALLASLLFVLLFFNSFETRAQEEIAIGSNSVVRFASVEKAADILGTRDDFIAALTPFERSARMVTNGAVSQSDFLKFASANVLAWTPGETNRLGSALETVAHRLEPWHLPFPTNIWLIKTTGHEEIDADYTRQSAIIQPKSMLPSAGVNILLHELFHVLSRANPDLREKLYGVIGFHRINEIAIAPDVAERLWTNPDGVQNGWRMAVTNHGELVQTVPGLFAPENFTYTNVVNPFSFFRLMVVHETNGKWEPALIKGHSQLLQTREVQGFNEQIGRNTRYVIHPDEILADNFVILMNGRTNIATPRIIEEMKQVFQSYK